MTASLKPLLNWTSDDLMSASVVMVPEEMSLQGAAHLLAQAHVTGAPVVNSEGRCVGVLSSTDFVNWVDRHRDKPVAPQTEYCASWQLVDPGELPKDAVHNYMTRDPVTVSQTSSIGELARLMIDNHIHRVIVTEKTGKPIGIVSSTDVLAAVARADLARITGNAYKTNKSVPC